MGTTNGRGRATALAGITVLVLAGVVAACGGGAASSDGVVSLSTPTPSSGASAAPSESVDPEVAMADFQACMKEHGADIQVAVVGDGGPGSGPVVNGQEPPPLSGDAQPAKPVDGSAPDMKVLQEAEAACRHLLPSGTLGDPNATMDPAMADQLLAFSKCMRDHGIDYPDPQFSGGGVTMEINGDLDPTSKTFQDAQTACGAELPGGGGISIGGTGTVPGAGAGQQP